MGLLTSVLATLLLSAPGPPPTVIGHAPTAQLAPTLREGPRPTQDRPETALPERPIARGGIAFRSATTGGVTLYNYSVARAADSVVVMTIEDLGELSEGSMLRGANGAATLNASPDSSRGAIRLPFLALRQLVETAERYEGVPSRATNPSMEIGISDGSLVLGLRRVVGVPIAITLAGLLALVSLIAYLAFQTRKARRSIAVLAQGQRVAIASREAERIRIAREIHDGPVQRLAAMALTIGSDHQSPRVAEEMRELTRELRGVADGLRPPSLERFGVGAAIEALAARVEEENPDMTVLAQVDERLKGERLLSPEDEVNLYRIAQEAVNNAVDHGGLSLLVIRVEHKNGLLLEVIDDGQGFSWPDDLGALRDAGHFGLVGIAERAELLDAKISVTESRAGGAHFVVTVPKTRLGAEVAA